MHYEPRQQDPRALGDIHRAEGPLAKTADGEWIVLGHPEAVEVATDPQRFSSQVSSHLQLPNGLDGEEHQRFRQLIDRYLDHDAMLELRPKMVEVAESIVAELPEGHVIDAVADLGAKFAVVAMTHWLGWSASLHERLLAWVDENQRASASGDREWTARVAEEFDSIILEVIEPRLADDSINDVTALLVRDESLGRRLEHEEIVSILRNWTGGDLGSMALSIGVIVAGLAERPELIERVREGSDAEAERIMNELLRIDNPFSSNRRVTTCPVTLAGEELPEGARLRIHWTSANRDERVFGSEFAENPHAEDNLVFGIGPHVCPGRELTFVELRAFFRTLLRRFDSIEIAGEPVRSVHPVGGFASLPVILR